ncbi:MAG TPA: COX aromatic rich motif-containing protein [Candidatus Saccharimonadales bacterium]|nr:COX aromatic rich motif-containing protein [Candidatus Saccharimonadales bacterium]
MKRLLKVGLIALVFLLLLTLFTLLAKNGNLQLLNPQGFIAEKQSQILVTALFLALIIGIPIVGITFLIAFKYREGNHKTKYTPDWTGSKALIFAWWAVPTAFVIILASATWISAHELDPAKPIESPIPPVTIQVVALEWKWLFIYPDEKIATVNFIEFPVNTPVNFELTADAPMNSFWIPSLGGQIYAMSGMVTHMHLIANKQGEFPGGAAEINGDGFSDMNFIAKSTTTTDYRNWLQTVRNSGKVLDLASYNTLSTPSTNNSRSFYYYPDKNLYNQIIMKFMAPPTEKMDMQNNQNMQGM